MVMALLSINLRAVGGPLTNTINQWRPSVVFPLWVGLQSDITIAAIGVRVRLKPDTQETRPHLPARPTLGPARVTYEGTKT
jgi:hypothetical protein